MNDKKNYSIKTPIAKLPKFEKTEGIILEVAKAVECIQGQPITTKSQTGSPYQMLNHQVNLLVMKHSFQQL